MVTKDLSVPEPLSDPGDKLNGGESSMHGNKETRSGDEEFRSDADHGESILCVRSPSRSGSGSRGRSKDSHGTRSPSKNGSKLPMAAVMEGHDTLAVEVAVVSPMDLDVHNTLASSPEVEDEQRRSRGSGTPAEQLHDTRGNMGLAGVDSADKDKGGKDGEEEVTSRDFLNLTMMPMENICGRKRYLPDLNVPLLNTDAASDKWQQTQSNSYIAYSLELTLGPTLNICGRKRNLPDLNVPLLNTDTASDKRRQTRRKKCRGQKRRKQQMLVPTTATPHPPPVANVVQPFSTDPASRQQPKSQSKRSFRDESIVNSLSFYTAVSSHHSDLEYSFRTAASSWQTGSFFTDLIPEIKMGTESQAETETRELRMRFASRFWGVGASGNGSFSVFKEQILDKMVESVVSGIVQECMQRFFDCL